ncbi:hypothetical protein [Pseudovibrio sp. SPO723]|uniref:hypothetical protein n=1 Tax=Nesiotobacter zosterae TaxID=392721 RepID=UPI0029C20BC3|nr:hypothetical protein [Pseudovibrio sp. SPO723]MDX5592579.1 hypothetical protein [Pseudovibrio sp. SPO723]
MSFTYANARLFVTKKNLPRTKGYTQADFESMEWQEVDGMVSVPDHGTSLSYENQPIINRKVSSKYEGEADAGSGTLTVAHYESDPGQIMLRSHAKSGLMYGVAIEFNNKRSATTTGTVRYNTGMIGGPTTPGGERSAFVNDIYNMEFTDQEQIEVTPVDGIAPTNSEAPTIIGAANVGSELSINLGKWSSVTPAVTYSYQWQADGADIADATSETYTIDAADTGAVITCEVTATNAFGDLTEVTAATPAVS